MKRIIVMLFISIIINMEISAQESTVIQTPVAYSQGFVLLRNDNNIDYWEIQIIDRNYINETQYTDVVVEQTEVIGDNYYTIPLKYTNDPNKYVKVKEHMNNGSINTGSDKITTDPYERPGYSSTLNKVWKCNGNTYAWGINQIMMTHYGNTYGSYFAVTTTSKNVSNTNPIIVTPYYQWFSPTQFAAFRNSIISGNQYINGVNYTDYYIIGNDLLTQNYNNCNTPAGSSYTPNTVNIVKLNYDPLHRKKDKNGAYITGVNYVYGIAKGLGPWGAPNNVAGSTCLSTDLTTYGQAAGANSIQFAINLINTNATSKPTNCNKPLLTCSSSGGVTNPSYVIIDKFHAIGPPAKKIIKDSLGKILNDILNIDNLNGNWWASYYSVTLTKLSGIRNEVMNVKIGEIYNETGLINDVPINMQEGLYSVLIQATDGSFITLYQEFIDQENSSSNTDANYLGKTIFPVPITDDDFSIALTATKDLNFVYKLFDFNMNLLYEVNCEIGEGESSTIHIDPGVSIPSGTLINQFIFEDGSQSSVLTIK